MRLIIRDETPSYILHGYKTRTFYGEIPIANEMIIP